MGRPAVAMPAAVRRGLAGHDGEGENPEEDDAHGSSIDLKGRGGGRLHTGISYVAGRTFTYGLIRNLPV
jgi:hypothetical protein